MSMILLSFLATALSRREDVSLAVRRHEGEQGQVGQVADGDLVAARELDHLRAQVGAFNGAEVLLVRLAVARILVEHIRRAGLDLGSGDGEPQIAHLDGPAGAVSVPLVPQAERASNSAPYTSLRPGASSG